MGGIHISLSIWNN